MKDVELNFRTDPDLIAEAYELRRTIVETLHRNGGGHFGGSLSVLDILLTLYRWVLRISPAAPADPLRDRLILSKGHAVMALYVVLSRLGFFPRDLLATYGCAGSPLEGHPDMRVLPGIDFSTGSLGQGVAAGLGMALALRDRGPHVWVVVGDGECQEGQIWEAAMLAARYRADNLHVVVDANGFQEYGWHGVGDVPVERLVDKWRAFDWTVFEADGHNHEQLLRAFSDCLVTCGTPSLVVARTVKGFGFPVIERDPLRFHCTQVSDDEYRAILDDGGPT